MTAQTINTLKINGKDLELEDKLARDTIGEGFNTTDKTVAKSLIAEQERAEAAELSISNSITIETNRAKAAEQANATAISTEETRAKAAEQTNASEIAEIKNELEKSGGLLERINSVETRTTTVESKIPSEASSTNQLADKNFVNSSIATSTATFCGTFDSVEELPTTGVDDNDYAFVKKTDEVGNKLFDRYKYSNNQWLYEYTLNNSSFTANQWAAINSGITDTLRASYDSHIANNDIHVTAENKTTWNAKQDKLTAGDGINITKVGDDLVISSSGGVDLVHRVDAIEAKMPMSDTFDDKTIKQYIDDADTTLDTAISAEETRAKGAEGTLTTNLANEVERATGAEATLTTNLANEVTRATTAEGTLTTNLANEVSRAQGAEATLTEDLAQEIEDRETAVAAEEARAKAVEGEVEEGKTLAGLISEEATARTNADTTLTTNLNAEISRAKGAEEALAGDISAEEERATAAEEALDTRLDTVEDVIPSEASSTNKLTDKAYVDVELAKKQNNLSDTQLAAVNSGITSEKVTAYDAHVADTDIHITSVEREKWNTVEDKAEQSDLEALSTRVTTAEGNIITLTNDKADKATTYTKTEVDSKVSDEATARETADTTLGGRIDDIEDLIPSGTTSENPLVNKEELDNKVAGAYKFKGSKETYEDLPTEGNVKGDVWNIKQAHETDPKFLAGTNVAWTGEEWDVLGGLVDLSLYAKVAYVDEQDTAIKNIIGEGFDDEDNTIAKVIEAEKAAREAADSTLTTNLNAEISRAEGAENTLTTNLAKEVSDREAAIAKEVLDRDAAILVETNRAKAVEGIVEEGKTLAGLISEETTARTNADTTLTTNLNAEISRAEGAEEALADDIADEEERAKDAEETLTTNLAKEVSDREDAITQEVAARNAAILVETNRAKSVEGEVAEGKTLAGLISEEATARTNADSTLTTNLANEVTRATEAEEGLASDITAEETRAKAAEEANAEAITAEQSRAEGAELELSDKIDQEVLDRQNAISEETSRAEDIENALDTRITEAEQAIEGLDDSKADKNDVYTKAEVGEGFSTTNTVKAYIDTKASTLQTNIDTEASTRLAKDAETLQSAKDYTDSKVSAEATARESADTTLTTNLAAEVERAKGAEGTLTTNLANEVTARTTGDSAINEKIGGNFSSTSTVAMAIAANTTAITTEATTRANEDTAIKAMIGTGFDSVNTVAKAIDTNANAIVTEKTRAMNAESILTTNLATEVSAREAADTAINTKVGSGFDGKTITTKVTEVSEALSSEITRATGVEGGLNTRLTTAETKIDTNTTNITNEVANRQLEDGKLDAKISSEATTRANADTELSNKLGTGFDSTNTVAKALANEATARTSGDATTLQSAKDYADSKVLAEETRAKAAEGTLTTNLANEVTARTNADTAEATARVEGDTTTLASAKTYTDEKVASALTSVYKYKGSVQNYEELQNVFPRTQGDVYNVVEEHTTAPKFPAGSNLAWVQTTETSGQWDVLGGTVDLSAYAKKEIIGNFTVDNTVEDAIDELDTNKADKATTLAGYGITNAYTKAEVDSSLALKQNALTEAQLNAVNSGITSTKVTTFESHLSDITNPHGVTKAQVGLDKVDNTSDLDKPISTATQTALNAKVNSADLATVATTGKYEDLLNKPVIDSVLSATSENAVQNKVIKAALDEKQPVGSYVTESQLNDKLATKVDTTFKINGNALSGSSLSTEQLLPAQSSSTNNYVLTSVKVDDSFVAQWTEKGEVLPSQTSHATHFLTTDGTTASWVAVDKTTVGLGNVDNTSDLNKPISTATQTALNGKADKATTLAGYGITDAYTKAEITTELGKKQDVIAVYKHTYFSSDWTKDGDMYKLVIPATTHDCGEEPLVKAVLIKEGSNYKKVPFSFNPETGVLDEGYTYEIDATGNVTIIASFNFDAKVMLASL